MPIVLEAESTEAFGVEDVVEIVEDPNDTETATFSHELGTKAEKAREKAEEPALPYDPRVIWLRCSNYQNSSGHGLLPFSCTSQPEKH